MAILDQIGLDLGQGNVDYDLADAQARANEAADYDPTATYAVNDLCLYEGVLKQCTTAIPVAEAWDATHWRTVTIGGQIVALRSRFTAPTAQAAGADGLVPGAAANTTGLYLKEDGTWGKPTGSDLETSSSDNTPIATTLSNLNDQIVALGPYNGLDSDSTTAALSAAQGKKLNAHFRHASGSISDVATGFLAEALTNLDNNINSYNTGIIEISTSGPFFCFILNKYNSSYYSVLDNSYGNDRIMKCTKNNGIFYLFEITHVE